MLSRRTFAVGTIGACLCCSGARAEDVEDRADLSCDVPLPASAAEWQDLLDISDPRDFRIQTADGRELDLAAAIESDPIGLRSVASASLAWRQKDSLFPKDKSRIVIGVGFFDTVSKADQSTILDLAAQWTNGIGLAFVATDRQKAAIRINLNPKLGGGWSKIGRSALKVGKSQPTMEFKVIRPFSILHEFGHAVGLFHEQQSPDAGFVWNEDAILADYLGKPWGNCDTGKKACLASIRNNITSPAPAGDVSAPASAYDPKSIMAYPVKKCWVTAAGKACDPKTYVLYSNDALSKQDLYAAQVIYGKA